MAPGCGGCPVRSQGVVRISVYFFGSRVVYLNRVWSLWPSLALGSCRVSAHPSSSLSATFVPTNVVTMEATGS